MNEIRIYVEGGGGKDSKAWLRTAFTQFLGKSRYGDERSSTLRVIMCGSRQEAYEAFRLGTRTHGGSSTVLLLVDAEGPVAGTEREHLAAQDRWDLSLAKDDSIHLMTQLMESWFVADRDALARFYGQDFASASIPKRKNVEEIPKAHVERALKDATRKTQRAPTTKRSTLRRSWKAWIPPPSEHARPDVSACSSVWRRRAAESAKLACAATSR